MSISGVSHAVGLSKTFTITEDDIGGAEVLSLVFRLGASEITITQAESDDFIIEAFIIYDSSSLEPVLSTSSIDNKFKATFKSGEEIDYNGGLYADIQQWEIKIGRYAVNTDIDIAGGGIELNADLGSMPLNSLLVSGAGADIDIDFSKPTSVATDEITVLGGGALLSINNIGNTGFDKFNLVSGGIRGDLDFSGEYSDGKHFVDITGGGNQLNISVPQDAGQRVDVTSVGAIVFQTGIGWIVEHDLFFFKRFTSLDYEAQRVKIDMDITAAGSLIFVHKK